MTSRSKEKIKTNWKEDIDKILKNGCTDSDIMDYIEEHPKVRGRLVWDYVYESTAPEACKGCKHIQMKGMYPCHSCTRQEHLKDYYEAR